MKIAIPPTQVKIVSYLHRDNILFSPWISLLSLEMDMILLSPGMDTALFSLAPGIGAVSGEWG
jgi:hypothetical protein